MQLITYIEQIGKPKFAEMLGVSETQVWRYQKLMEVPRPELARKIKQLTHGLVGYEDIYEPFFAHNEDAAQLELDV